MAITPISAAGLTLPTPPVTPPATTSPDAATGSGGSGFGNALVQALDGVQQTQNTADQVARLAATGDLTNIHDLTIATSEAELATQLTTAVRDKAVAAFNAIMSMPV
jgi:flagellar hook-basal body complex protein FliE